MFSLLLVVIYLAFISLGLPDSLLGSSWPVVRGEMGVPLSYAGIVSMIISAGTIVSSLLSDRLTKKFGAGLVTAVSVFMTFAALFGFSVSTSFWFLCVWAVPYGLGAGAVDAALNNFVAVHYASRHMNWLHCFWGVGAAISPYIMGYTLSSGLGWRSGYRFVSALQAVLVIALFFSLPLWKRAKTAANEHGERAHLKLSQIFGIKGVKFVLIAFFAYCSLEITAGLWASSYLALEKGMDTVTAARYASFFYLGITFGRFLCGFISEKVGDTNMIRAGVAVVFAGIAAMLFPFPIEWLYLGGLIVVGLGCAPIYPAIIHSTPRNFGAENSQAIVGVQMAFAYTGYTIMPPLFGAVADKVGIWLYPSFLLCFAVLMFMMTEKLNNALE